MVRSFRTERHKSFIMSTFCWSRNHRQAYGTCECRWYSWWLENPPSCTSMDCIVTKTYFKTLYESWYKNWIHLVKWFPFHLNFHSSNPFDYFELCLSLTTDLSIIQYVWELCAVLMESFTVHLITKRFFVSPVSLTVIAVTWQKHWLARTSNFRPYQLIGSHPLLAWELFLVFAAEFFKFPSLLRNMECWMTFSSQYCCSLRVQRAFSSCDRLKHHNYFYSLDCNARFDLEWCWRWRSHLIM